MKKFLILASLIIVFILSGCSVKLLGGDNGSKQSEQQPADSIQAKRTDEEKEKPVEFFPEETDDYFSVEMESYENKEYGYKLELPESWGAINAYGCQFQDELYDEMERIGPYLDGDNCDERYTIYIEVFTDNNSARAAGESWFDFYKSLRLEDKKYEIFNLPNVSLPVDLDVVLFDGAGEYAQTCRLMENNNKLYAFCYNGDNIVHLNIIRSIDLF